MSDLNNLVTIIVCGNNGKILQEELKASYADTEDVNVELAECYEINNRAELYILVGATNDVEELAQKINGNVIKLSDDIILKTASESNNLSIIRNQIIDGILAPLVSDKLIDIDLEDILNVFRGAEDTSISLVNSKEISSLEAVSEKLIAKADVDISECSKAYLYIEGDVSLMEINEIATSLAATIGEDKYIAFTAVYNPSTENQYNVMTMFVS